MQFKLSSFIATLLACQATQATPVVVRDTQEIALTVNDFVNFVNTVTQQTASTTNIVNGITSNNAKTQLQAALKDIHSTIQTVDNAKSQLNGVQKTKPNADEQVQICNAFTGLFNGEQALFKAVAAKKDVIKATPGIPAIAPGLRSISTAIDQIPINLLGSIWPCGADVGKSVKALSDTLKQAVAAFS